MRFILIFFKALTRSNAILFSGPTQLSVAVITFFCSAFCTIAHASQYDLGYHVSFTPKEQRAEIVLTLNHTDKISVIDFNLKKSQCSDFKSASKIKKKKQRLLWYPKGKSAQLRYHCKITHKREKQNGQARYDAFITEDWALFRGDDLAPPAKVRAKKGWYSKASITFNLPKDWPSVNTEWERDLSQKNGAPVFLIDNPTRSFDRPTGWMIAGKLGTRRAKLVDGEHTFRMAVSAPSNSEFRRMDVLTFMQLIWPEFKKAFDVRPKKVLIVGAGEPMWRGGLSAGNSFYMHENRPIISENGTSTLAHEMFHMLTGIRGKKGSDWIAEGLAEYYSLNLLKRAGGMNEERYQDSLKKLRDWSKDVKSLSGKHSKGETTAAAVLLFDELDNEIKSLTNKKYNLDTLVKQLILLKKSDLSDLKEIFSDTTGKRSCTLTSELVSPKQTTK